MAFSKYHLYDPVDQFTSDFAHAFGHPARLSILEKLITNGPLCVEIIAEGHPISKPALSDHLKVLRVVQLIDWQERFPYTFYYVNERKIEEAEKLIMGYFNRLKNR